MQIVVTRYLNCLNELCVAAAAPAADHNDKRANTAGQTTITNFLLFFKYLHALDPFTSHNISMLHPPAENSQAPLHIINCQYFHIASSRMPYCPYVSSKSKVSQCFRQSKKHYIIGKADDNIYCSFIRNKQKWESQRRGTYKNKVLQYDHAKESQLFQCIIISRVEWVSKREASGWGKKTEGLKGGDSQAGWKRVGVKETERRKWTICRAGLNNIQSPKGPLKQQGDETSCAPWHQDSAGAVQGPRSSERHSQNLT